MNITRRKLLLTPLALSSAIPFTRTFASTNYPNKPIRLIISFPPGSASDLLARHLGEHISRTLGQPVIIEPKPGAQGVVSARAVARSPNDGYTLFLGGNSTHAANLYLIKDLEYDPIKDFTAISQYTINPLVLAVKKELPVNSVQEFIDYAKARPGTLNYGTGNSGSLVAAQLLKTQAGINATGVNYSGTSQAITDLVGGRLDFMVVDYLVIRAFMESGVIRALGLTSKQALSSLPDVPPLAEAGLPHYNYASWTGIFGPAGLPADVTQKLNTAIRQAVDTPETQKFLADLGIIATSSSPGAFESFVKEQIVVWGQLSKDAGLSVL